MLYEQIFLAQNGDQSALLGLIEQFAPLLKKYSRLLQKEDAFEDLQAEFIETIVQLRLDHLRSHSDGAIVAYLSKTVRSKYIAQSKQHKLDANTVYWDDLEEAFRRKHEPRSPLLSGDEMFLQAIPPGVLNEKETDIITKIYLYGYSVAEIAHTKGITRQAVNQIKVRALHKLKNALDNN